MPMTDDKQAGIAAMRHATNLRLTGIIADLKVQLRERPIDAGLAERIELFLDKEIRQALDWAENDATAKLRR